ncbi:hypothetical protein EDC04DRAFT_2603378 [Pisolithus marmoratus]|nr:hypothetical protein EDC04DRAFT_2603378 [Pisolithus marmoratus]
MSVDDDQSFMSIIDQVKVDVVSPTHDLDNARQLGAVSRCFATDTITGMYSLVTVRKISNKHLKFLPRKCMSMPPGHRSATLSWHNPSMQAPEMHTPQLTRKEAALVASGSMTNQLAVRIRWSCTAYRRTTHPFGAVKKNLACANTGLGAVTECVANCAICPLDISGNGPFSTWTNYPFSNWTNHPFPIGQSAIPPLTELVVWKNEGRNIEFSA